MLTTQSCTHTQPLITVHAHAATAATITGYINPAHTQVRGLLVPLVQPWVPLVCAALGHDPAARPLWPTKLAALRLGQAVTSYFSKPLAAVMPPLMTASWQLLLALQVCCCL